MEIEKTAIEGVFVVRPHIHRDVRGLFFECFNAQGWDALGFQNVFVQDNVAESSYGVIRGLHLQVSPSAQAKLVSALQGRILDVAVDLRKHSPTARGCLARRCGACYAVYSSWFCARLRGTQ